MNCPTCGREMPDALSDQRVSNQQVLKPSRGRLIHTLGILSLIIFGPLAGIPAWLMGSRELKKIRDGRVSSSRLGFVQSGRTCGIVGTFFSVGFWVVISAALTLVAESERGSFRTDVVENHLREIASSAKEYRSQHTSARARSGSFEGYTLPLDQTFLEVHYAVEVLTPNLLRLTANWEFYVWKTQRHDVMTAFVDSSGQLLIVEASLHRQ